MARGKHPRQRVGRATNSALSTAVVPWNTQTAQTDRLVLQPLVEQIFRCIQTSTAGQSVYSAATGNSTFSLTPTLAVAAAANSSALVALFDQYKIECVEIIIEPQQNFSAGGGLATAGAFVTPPQLFTVLDFDDATSLASPTAAGGYASCIVTECYEKQRRCFRPRIAYAAYSGAFTSYANQVAGWIDCNSANVLHYGAKALVTPDGNASIGQRALWDVTMRVQLAFRSTH